MSDDAQIILNLTRENAQLKRELAEAKRIYPSAMAHAQRLVSLPASRMEIAGTTSIRLSASPSCRENLLN
jgi:hypothetical protein